MLPISNLPMFKLGCAVIIGVGLLSPIVVDAATPIHKCTIEGAVTYQSDPCPSGERRKQPTPAQLNTERHKKFQQQDDSAKKQAPAGNGAQDAGGQSPDQGISGSGMVDRKNPSVDSVEKKSNQFQCDRRIYCSQMTSCAEAKYFLTHCPGVKMDGDRNGIPCEKQWCNP